MQGGITNRDVKLQIAKYFPWCPFCCSEKLEIDVEPDRAHDYIICDNCEAKWEVKIKEKIRSIKLVSASVGWKGKELLEKEIEPKFWQNKAWLCILTRRNPHKS
ncbi:hypothetical protein KAS06_00660 [Candidatus Bathyarchaeota archaeon]|nr:hypothetical protein [Candidatus Bathyarchaeota archaeon]